MINGLHALIYAKDADKARAFFRDVMKFRTVDVGHGWLIFALPPAELGIHPTDSEDVYHELYLMCDNMSATLVELEAKGVEHSDTRDVGWGVLTSVVIPGAGSIGLYQPKHPTAIAPMRSPNPQARPTAARKVPKRLKTQEKSKRRSRPPRKRTE